MAILFALGAFRISQYHRFAETISCAQMLRCKMKAGSAKPDAGP
jgi:hypothetical protein